MTLTGEWRLPPLRGVVLIGDAVRTALAATPRLWPVWLVLLAIAAAAFAGMRQLMGDQLVLAFPQAALSGLALSAATAVPAALSIRGFLGAPLWRLDRGLLVYVLIQLAFTVCGDLPVMALMASVKAAKADVATLQWVGFSAGTAAWLAMLYPSARLLPWAAGQAVGDAQCTARHVWSAMRGAIWPVIFAVTALSAVPYVVQNIAWGQYYYGRGPVALAVASVVVVVQEVLVVSLQAVVYRRRIAEAERFSDVFA